MCRWTPKVQIWSCSYHAYSACPKNGSFFFPRICHFSSLFRKTIFLIVFQSKQQPSGHLLRKKNLLKISPKFFFLVFCIARHDTTTSYHIYALVPLHLHFGNIKSTLWLYHVVVSCRAMQKTKKKIFSKKKFFWWNF